VKIRIISSFQASWETYGYRRIRLGIEGRYGSILSQKTVRKLMNELDIHPLQRKKRRYSSYIKQERPPEPNLLKRVFLSGTPYRKPASDVIEFDVGGRALILQL
jgi:transposase InsO family protein